MGNIYISFLHSKEVGRSPSLADALFEATFYPAGATIRIEKWHSEDGYLVRDSQADEIEITINRNTLSTSC